MSTAILYDRKLFVILNQIDSDLAEKTRTQGCSCGADSTRQTTHANLALRWTWERSIASATASVARSAACERRRRR